jgi:hypothetical protein
MPKHVDVWDYPCDGKPLEICPRKAHVGVLEDIT